MSVTFNISVWENLNKFSDEEEVYNLVESGSEICRVEENEYKYKLSLDANHSILILMIRPATTAYLAIYGGCSLWCGKVSF